MVNVWITAAGQYKGGEEMFIAIKERQLKCKG